MLLGLPRRVWRLQKFVAHDIIFRRKLFQIIFVSYLFVLLYIILFCIKLKCPGLVVMGRDSRSEGRGFESQHRILDGLFSHVFVEKIVMMFV